MKQKNMYHLWVIISGILILSACLGEQPGNSETMMSTPANTEATVLRIPQTPTPTFTLLPSPLFPVAATITPIVVNSSPTHTVVIPTNTPLIPTLSVEGAGVFLSELMTSNWECELPCWWGVIPGETTEQMAHDMFMSWGIREWIISDSYRIVNLGYARPGFPHYIPDVTAKLWIKDDLVQYIYISGQKPAQGLEQPFTEDWQQYSLSEILNRFGTPAYVRLESTLPDGSSTTYVLELSYPSIGIEIGYVIEVDALNDQQLLICPDFAHFRFITLDLYPPTWGTEVPEYIIPNHLEEYISWESVTGSEVESFYDFMKCTIRKVRFPV